MSSSILNRVSLSKECASIAALCYNNRIYTPDKAFGAGGAAAVQSISEIIQTIARQRGRGETPAQVTLFQLEAAAGERISHLPIEAELSQAWVALTGEPFRPHQAHALTALRRGEPVALRAASADVAMTAHLLLYAMLLADHDAAALVVAP